MYYSSWNKYLNKSSPEIEIKPLKPVSLPFEKSSRPQHVKSANKHTAPPAVKPRPTPTSYTSALAKSPSSQIASTFTLFPLLPTELRLKIWKHFYESTTPQVLNFRLCPLDVDHIPHKRKPCFAHPHIFALKQQSIPTILHICPESREVGLSHYKVGFDVQPTSLVNKEPCSHQSACEETRIKGKERDMYWNPEKDVVYIELGWAVPDSTVYTWGGSPTMHFRDIKHVALGRKTYGYVGIARKSMIFDDLSSLFIVADWRKTMSGQTGDLDRERQHWKRLLRSWGGSIQRNIVGRKKLDFRFVVNFDEVLELLE